MAQLEEMVSPRKKTVSGIVAGKSKNNHTEDVLAGRSAGKVLRTKILMVLSMMGFLAGVVLYGVDLRTVLSLPDVVSASNPYPNPYGIDLSGLGAVFLICLSVYGIAHGVFFFKYPHRKRRQAPWLIAVAVTLAFFTVSQLLYAPVVKQLLEKQHSWAEQRYGIDYEEISTFQTKSRSTDRTWQDKVISKGQVIAEVCPRQGYEISFCVPGTLQELPLVRK